MSKDNNVLICLQITHIFRPKALFIKLTSSPTLVTVFSGDFTGCSGGGLDFLFDGVRLILGEWNLSFSFIVNDVKWERWDSEGRQKHTLLLGELAQKS